MSLRFSSAQQKPADFAVFETHFRQKIIAAVLKREFPQVRRVASAPQYILPSEVTTKIKNSRSRRVYWTHYFWFNSKLYKAGLRDTYEVNKWSGYQFGTHGYEGAAKGTHTFRPTPTNVGFYSVHYNLIRNPH